MSPTDRRPPPLSREERERRRGGFSPLDRLDALHDLPAQVDMTVLMDDVPDGGASAAVDAGHPAGDCLRACLASVFGCDLDQVPHFVQYVRHPAGTDDHLWWWALVGFAHASGWEATYDPDEAPAGWSLADGKSPRGHSHVCVAYDGEVVFDPHPAREGLTEIIGWIGLRRTSDQLIAAQSDVAATCANANINDDSLRPESP